MKDDDRRYMVRWKRAARNKWYYAPMTYGTEDEATTQAVRSAPSLYRIEVVELRPLRVWGSDDGVQ